ncbi:MAG: class II aldolase/adducin family protein [Anaerolineales bacterium]|jgi:L-ribulose-5-phosphate 4-epimerase
MLEELRIQVAEATMAMWKDGLVKGAQGNVSGRDPETGHVAITPSHVPYAELTAEDIGVLTTDGEQIWGKHKPSSETPMHTYLYRQREALGAIMHTHSEYALAASVVGRSIPPITLDIAFHIGSQIVAVDFVEPGTEELGIRVHEAMKAADARAALLANHGALALGNTVKGALEAARALEHGARVLMRAVVFGEPKPIPPEYVERFHRFWQERQVGAG